MILSISLINLLGVNIIQSVLRGGLGEVACILEITIRATSNATNQHPHLCSILQKISTRRCAGSRFVRIIALYSHTGETGTISECTPSYAGHTRWYGDAGETVTSIECTPSYAGHTIWYGDAGETGTFFECPLSYAGHTLSNGDAGETATIYECSVPYAGHALWYGDAGETATSIECITSYASHTSIRWNN